MTDWFGGTSQQEGALGLGVEAGDAAKAPQRRPPPANVLVETLEVDIEVGVLATRWREIQSTNLLSANRNFDQLLQKFLARVKDFDAPGGQVQDLPLLVDHQLEPTVYIGHKRRQCREEIAKNDLSRHRDRSITEQIDHDDHQSHDRKEPGRPQRDASGDLGIGPGRTDAH
jgi:hypothetical protein